MLEPKMPRGDVKALSREKFLFADDHLFAFQTKIELPVSNTSIRTTLEHLFPPINQILKSNKKKGLSTSY